MTLSESKRLLRRAVDELRTVEETEYRTRSIAQIERALNLPTR